jgi:hypothetical protein
MISLFSRGCQERGPKFRPPASSMLATARSDRGDPLTRPRLTTSGPQVVSQRRLCRRSTSLTRSCPSRPKRSRPTSRSRLESHDCTSARNSPCTNTAAGETATTTSAAGPITHGGRVRAALRPKRDRLPAVTTRRRRSTASTGAAALSAGPAWAPRPRKQIAISSLAGGTPSPSSPPCRPSPAAATPCRDSWA